MLTVTKKAAEHLVYLGKKAPGDTLPRMQEDAGKLNLAWDQEKPNDQKVDHEGSPILVYDASLEPHLGDRKLDVMETDDGPALTLK